MLPEDLRDHQPFAVQRPNFVTSFERWAPNPLTRGLRRLRRNAYFKRGANLAVATSLKLQQVKNLRCGKLAPNLLFAKC